MKKPVGRKETESYRLSLYENDITLPCGLVQTEVVVFDL